MLLCNIRVTRSGSNEAQKDNNDSNKHDKNCPYTKIIEDIFKVHNRTQQSGIYLENSERVKGFLNSISNVTVKGPIDNKTMQEEQVNSIIASIKRIKDNMTTDIVSGSEHLNEAIILNMPKDKNEVKNKIDNKISKFDENKTLTEDNKKGIFEHLSKLKNSPIRVMLNTSNNHNSTETDQKEKPTYVEIMTIEPNNVYKNNSSSHNIIDILRHLMPMFNSTMTKELHNITVIERDRSKNHSFSEIKNISTIVVTYCDHENLTKANVTFDNESETVVELPKNTSHSDDYFTDKVDENVSISDDETYEDMPEANLTVGEKKDLLEATEYGMQKMHELYSIMEPKLYSMGKLSHRYLLIHNHNT